MSVLRARAIIKTVRWYHLGFAFLWAATFSGLTLPVVGVVEAGSYDIYNVCCQVCTIVAVIAMALFVRFSGRLAPRPHVAVFGADLLALGAFLFYVLFYFEVPQVPVAVLAGACVGAGSGIYFVFWQHFFTSEGATRTAIYIPLSAVASAIFCFILQLVPELVAMICTVVVLPALAAWSLLKSLGEVELPEVLPIKNTPVRGALRDLWQPVLCVCALGFIWKLVSHLVDDTSGFATNIAFAGFAIAALVVALIELFANQGFSKHGFEVVRFYQILFPIIIGVFLLSAILTAQFTPPLSAVLMFSFETLNLLLLVICAVYANEHFIASAYVYALFITPTMVFMLAGDAIGMQLSAAFTHDESFFVGVLFICLFILVITMTLVSWRSHRSLYPDAEQTSGQQNTGEPTDQQSAISAPESQAQTTPNNEVSYEEVWKASLMAKLDSLNLAEPLSQREREILPLMMRGHSVAAMAQELFISENTVRGHTKNVYRKLDVHSRQQLMDLLDN